MPSLADLATNLSNFQYYSGLGNFTANNLPANSGQAIVREPGQRWSLGLSDNLTPFGAVTTVNRTLADVKRVTDFLYTTPQGPQFLIKQTGLQFSNVEIEHAGQELRTNRPTRGQGFLRNAANTISNFANKISNDYGPTRIYNPLGLSTIAQTGLVAAGVRLTKHGLLPSFSERDPKAYENYIKSKDIFDDNGNTNRLFRLVKELSNNESVPQIYVLKYKGGPGSIYGIGDTAINRSSYILNENYNELKGLNKYNTTNNNHIPLQNLLTIPFNRYADKIKLKPYKPETDSVTGSSNTTEIGENVDFREVVNKIVGRTVLMSSDYKNKNLEKRVGAARARKRNEDRSNYASDVPDASDKINKLSLFYGTSIADAINRLTKDINNNQVTKDNTRDLIKFRIKSYDNDAENGAGVYMVFRAYVSNIKRGIQSKWNPYSYVGRGESFYLYDGFTESITLQFTIAASSRSEMKPLYQKLNYLISTMTPDYSKQNRMRGNISELTVGDFIKYQPGVITNLDIIIDEDTNWEIAIDDFKGGKDESMHELPQMLKCNMTFIPIYDFLPRKSAEAPFIGINDIDTKFASKEWTKTNSEGVNNLLRLLPDPRSAADSNNIQNPMTDGLQNMA